MNYFILFGYLNFFFVRSLDQVVQSLDWAAFFGKNLLVQFLQIIALNQHIQIFLATNFYI